MKRILVLALIASAHLTSHAQTKQDTLAITRAALDYIESQIKPNGEQMNRALHPRLVKRTFWTDQATQRDFVYEASAENMVILAERYNKKGDKFPAQPRKDVKLLDVASHTASVKLTADEWIDYMHLAKLNGEWKIVNVMWQFNDPTRHRQ